ncbi:MAG: SDR family oxidoreductase [Deltaproteobacteria bacterium]|nr:SDR family oxidoreductase [Deltaproteobacteria bacterium]MBW2359415.1 SDR family oxidoreductase [Deltaproteobacteria bacterium]
MTASDPLGQFRLDGKVALVTGGSRGLGKELVLAFARCGADVVIASRKEESCVALADAVKSETGRRALPVRCHVAKWSDCDALVENALGEFGKVDVLVNNAGSSPLYPSLIEISEELYDKVMGTNLKGAFRLSALLGTKMAEGDGGSIINVSSIGSVMPSPGEIPYAAAKAALNNLTEGMARAFAPKVRVNCIMPGAFLTDISKAWSPQMKDALTSMAALGRAGEPDEIVGAALYLASDAGRYSTGSIIKVDGGAAYGHG